MSATPYDKCCCAVCGPPWRDVQPEPDRETEFGSWLGWHSWMALCPTCGNKRCPGAADHSSVCDDELIAIAKSVPLGRFLYRAIYDAGVAAGRIQALEEAATLIEAQESPFHFVPDTETFWLTKAILARSIRTAIQEGNAG